MDLRPASRRPGGSLWFLAAAATVLPGQPAACRAAGARRGRSRGVWPLHRLNVYLSGPRRPDLPAYELGGMITDKGKIPGSPALPVHPTARRVEKRNEPPLRFDELLVDQACFESHKRQARLESHLTDAPAHSSRHVPQRRSSRHSPASRAGADASAPRLRPAAMPRRAGWTAPVRSRNCCAPRADPGPAG